MTSITCEEQEHELEHSDDIYDPALEFPSSSEVSPYPLQTRVSSPSPHPVSNRTTVFRLIRTRSTILSQSKRVAVFDGQAEVSIGRDVAPAARVRLKEMAVSKYHASIYWDGMRREWAIVDMGSMHGTFVRSVRDSSPGASGSVLTSGTRLSAARKSSLPRVLKHLDKITVGGTTFLVHEHTGGRPCAECTTEDGREIPLFSTRKQTSEGELSHKRKRTDSGDLDAKRVLSSLKSSLLSHHGAWPTSSSSTYRDRSALRRELHPERHVPPLPLMQLEGDVFSSSTSQVAIEEPPPTPPTPLPSSNIGHKLLLQQGWSPGTGLGEHETGLVEPIVVHSHSARVGLGASVTRPSVVSQGDWREKGKQRRWEDARDRLLGHVA